MSKTNLPILVHLASSKRKFKSPDLSLTRTSDILKLLWISSTSLPMRLKNLPIWLMCSSQLCTHSSKTCCSYQRDLQCYHQQMQRLHRWTNHLWIHRRWRSQSCWYQACSSSRCLHSIQDVLLRVQGDLQEPMENHYQRSFRQIRFLLREMPRHYASYQHHYSILCSPEDWNW